MKRRILYLRSLQVVIDFTMLSLAYAFSFLFRFDWEIPHQMLKRMFFLWPYVVGLQYGLHVIFGVHRFSWRYVGLREAVQILLSTTAASGVLLVMRLSSAAFVDSWGYAQYAIVPLGVIAVYLPLAYLGTVGVRVVRRLFVERVDARKNRASGSVPTLLIGAGQGGLAVAKALCGRPALGLLPVGFLDDDPMKIGTELHGFRVLGRTEDVSRFASKYGVSQAIITISSATGPQVRRIAELCQKAGLTAKIVPDLAEIVAGRLSFSSIRQVAIEDLLGREPVVLDEGAISENLRDRVVMVTGAGGSIGSELCRQICAFGPECLLLVERAENALFEIHQELIRNFPDLALKPVLADICDRKRIDQVLSDEQPTVIFHAAAHKHVPMMELNPGEAVKNNVFGTRTLAELADLHHVETFVMISTDKAVNPSSIMGTSKRLAEVFLQAFSGRSETRFVTVRFGNVLGSAGSVIPIFKAQLARGGPITVTHAEMERYFMTIPEAVQLVLQAATMGEGGEIFILNMGEPVKIIDLARDLIRLSGFQEPDIEIRITGMRPGEKLREELSKAEEQLNNTGHPKIYVGRAPAQDYRSVRNGLWQLAEAMEAGDAESVPLLLQKLVPEYRPASSGAQTDSASFEVAPVSAETRSGKTLRRAVS